MLYVILSFLILIGFISFFVHELYSYHKSCKAERKEWEDFIKSLIPGSKWKLYRRFNVNPFDELSSNIIVTVIETRKNFYGDIWVQYRFENSKITNEKQAADFKRLYNKLN
jgi:hypothetical protein